MADQNRRALARLAATMILDNREYIEDRLGPISDYLTTDNTWKHVYFKKAIDGRPMMFRMEQSGKDGIIIQPPKSIEVAVLMAWEQDEWHPMMFGVDIDHTMIMECIIEAIARNHGSQTCNDSRV